MLKSLVRVSVVALVFSATLSHAQNRPVFDEPLVIPDITNDPSNDVVKPEIPVDLQAIKRRNTRINRLGRLGIVQSDGKIVPLANQRQSKVQGSFLNRTNDPYAPLGLRVGSFLVFPTISQSLGYTTNAAAFRGGEASAFSQTDMRLRAVSDWSRHQLTLDAGGGYQHFLNGKTDDYRQVDGRAVLDLDLGAGLKGGLEAGFEVRPESLSNSNLDLASFEPKSDRLNVFAYRAGASLRRDMGMMRLGLRVDVERTTYEDIDLTSGGTFSQEDRNNTLANVTGRLHYNTGAVFSPFVEGEAGLRRFDNQVSQDGLKRDSTLAGFRAGLVVDSGAVLSGELAVGYKTERFDDNSLSDLGAFTVDGRLDWKPSDLTTVSLNARTDFDPSTQLDNSGSITRTGLLGIERQLRDNLTIKGQVLVAGRKFEGSDREDTTLQLRVGAEWRLNRSVSLFSSGGYETVDSSDPEASYDAATAQIGLRLSR